MPADVFVAASAEAAAATTRMAPREGAAAARRGEEENVAVVAEAEAARMEKAMVCSFERVKARRERMSKKEERCEL